MAILHALPGLSVTIALRDGKQQQTCREYVDTNDGAEPQGEFTALKYIESRPGRGFCVDINFTPDFLHHTNFAMGAFVWVDGVKTNTRAFHLRHLAGGKLLTRISDAEDTDEYGNRVQRQFGFADMAVDDDEELWVPDRLVQQVQRIGEINVDFFRKLEIPPDARKYRAPRGSAVPMLSELECLDVIPEKALKGRAVSQRASFGESRFNPYRRKPNATNYKWIDYPKRAPYASFTFRYRSLRDLRSEMIIPRSPSPVPQNWPMNGAFEWNTSNQVKAEIPGEPRTGLWAGLSALEGAIGPLEDGEVMDGEGDEVVFLYKRPKQGPLSTFAPAARMPAQPALPVYALNKPMDEPLKHNDKMAVYGEEVAANEDDDEEDDIQFVFEREIPEPQEPRSDSVDLIDLGGWD